MQYIILDGTEYKVRVTYKTLSRTFEIIEGQNGGTAISGKTIRDIVGTKYNYSMSVEPDPQNPTDYDAFFDAISSPAESHTVVLPYGQNTISFTAYITSGSDTYGGKLAGYERWSGMTVNFTALAPQRS